MIVVFFSEYGISLDDEYVQDEADETGSRTIVSRTSIGEKTSFCKEFGVSSWEYDWKISVPLRTIMLLDLPRVEYIAPC